MLRQPMSLPCGARAAGAGDLLRLRLLDLPRLSVQRCQRSFEHPKMRRHSGRYRHPEGHAMQVRLITTAAVVASLVTTFAMRDAQAYDYTAPVPFHTVANFDPALGVVPFPNNLLLTGSTDLTLNIPVANPNNFADPQVALNALDGFSTSAPWSMTFSQPIDPTTLVGGQTVRMFEVSLSGPGGGVTGIQRELASPQEFVVASAPSDATGRTLAIVPTSALKQMTSYMAVVTNGIN